MSEDKKTRAPRTVKVKLLKGITDFDGKDHKAGKELVMEEKHFNHFDKYGAVKKL